MKPTLEERSIARQAAERLRETGGDAEFLAKSLLYLLERDQLLDKLWRQVELYLKFGEAPQEHARLMKLLQEIERFEAQATAKQDEHLGPL